MIYLYRCPVCTRDIEVYKHHSQAGDAETCPDCGVVMDRQWTGIFVSVPNQDGWNPGLGCSQRNVKDKLKRLKEDRIVTTKDSMGNVKKSVVKGVELHEIGNEKINTKVKHNDYVMSKKEEHEIGRILSNG